MLTSEQVTQRSFTPTSFRRGYDEREVDDFLDQIVETLRYYERGGQPGPQAPVAPTPPTSSAPPGSDGGHGGEGRTDGWTLGDPPA